MTRIGSEGPERRDVQAFRSSPTDASKVAAPVLSTRYIGPPLVVTSISLPKVPMASKSMPRTALARLLPGTPLTLVMVADPELPA